MSFKAFEEVHGDQTLTLPIRGKRYVIHPPRADVGYALAMQLAAGIVLEAGVPLTDDDLAEAESATRVADDQLESFAQKCLNGPHDGKPVEVYEEMLADGLSFPEVEMAAQTAFLAWTSSREAAEHFWNTGGKARAQRRQHPALRQTETPTPEAAANTSTASAIGTRRKARARAAKAERSPSSSRTSMT